MKTTIALAATTILVGPVRSEKENAWRLEGEAWKTGLEHQEGLDITAEHISPAGERASLRTRILPNGKQRKLDAITLEQSPVWQNWDPIANIGPANLRDAPVFLAVGPGDYWIFGRYGGRRPSTFTPAQATLEGFDVPLQTTPYPGQYDAPGGLKPRLGGYHAWQSRDMVNWVHHGPITERKSAWMTSAEYADGKAYFYYDFPNDQDPHVYVDSDLFDGLPGENKGMAYDDPSHGSDSGIIRDLQGNFHLIVEDWSPIHAQSHAWDSPLAAHAVSPDGIRNFKTLPPPVDERTRPTGKTGTYRHPHWVKEHPQRFKTNIAEYEIHEPAQNAYGDWAAICIGGQYYLFCDFDPADSRMMSAGWFTSPSLDQKFTWCDSIGRGHPDPDIMFARGRFYLITQQKTDYVSPGPWVETVELRAGVDTNGDGKIDQWSNWQEVRETYHHVPGFAKQVRKSPARLDLEVLPAGYGFQAELRIRDSTANKSKPMIRSLEFSFE